MKQWLVVRWEQFSRDLAELTKEEEIAHLCAQELAAWRARPQMKQASSLRVPMTDMRQQLKMVPLTDQNSWFNPRTRKREHIALKYLNFSEEEWAAMDAPSGEQLQQRMEQQKLLNQPELIVRKAEALLESKRWEEIVVGLAVLTGRRLSEVLKTGRVLPKTCYTAIFSGQLKRKDQLLDPYEIPTLIEVETVIEAWDRLRTLLDCSGVETRVISVKYGPAVKAAAKKQFVGIVPVREGREDLYTHLFRTVYGRIAVYYYCPPRVVDLTYLATIQGHYWVLDAKTEKQQRDYAATLHYYDYKIGDGAGNIDGRQGIRLGERDVQVLEIFQGREEQTKEGESEGQAEQPSLSRRASNKTGYSMLSPKQQTRVLFDEIAQELGTHHHDETLQILIKEHYQVRQLQERIRQTQEATAGEERAEVVLASSGVPVELQALLDGLTQEGVSDPLGYIRGLLQRDVNFREGLAKRYAGIDYTQIPFAQLSHLKTSEATIERLRRATKAVMEHNAATQEPLARWYLNQSALHLLVGGRKAAIADYLEAHKEEIEAHHQQYGLTAVYNRKPVPITEMIHLAEEVQGEA